MTYLNIIVGLGLVLLAYVATVRHTRRKRTTLALSRILRVITAVTDRTYHRLKDHVDYDNGESAGDLWVGDETVNMLIHDTKITFRVLSGHFGTKTHIQPKTVDVTVYADHVPTVEDAWDVVIAAMMAAKDSRIQQFGHMFAETAYYRRNPQPCPAV